MYMSLTVVVERVSEAGTPDGYRHLEKLGRRISLVVRVVGKKWAKTPEQQLKRDKQDP